MNHCGKFDNCGAVSQFDEHITAAAAMEAASPAALRIDIMVAAYGISRAGAFYAAAAHHLGFGEAHCGRCRRGRSRRPIRHAGPPQAPQE